MIHKSNSKGTFGNRIPSLMGKSNSKETFGNRIPSLMDKSNSKETFGNRIPSLMDKRNSKETFGNSPSHFDDDPELHAVESDQALNAFIHPVGPAFKPFPFALSAAPEGSIDIAFGVLIAQINALEFDGEGLFMGGGGSGEEGQTGLILPEVVVPSNFEDGGISGSRFKTARIEGRGDVYLYWETDNAGEVDKCEIKVVTVGDIPPDNSLPLEDEEEGGDGEVVADQKGRFSVKIGSVPDTVDSIDDIEQLISSDFSWTSAFILQEESSSSDSADSGGDGGGGDLDDSGGSDDGGGSGSDKSTAIVPASWNDTGYTALFIAEMPEVRFDDILEIIPPPHGSRKFTASIDPRFIEVCQKGTVDVVGYSTEKPVPVGLLVEGGEIQVELPFFRRPKRIVVRVSAIRRGFASQRFPDRRRDQFVANEKFINSAYKS